MLVVYKDIYFYTATINNWINALESDQAKTIICQSLQHFVDKGKCTIWGFVIMPNHIHLGLNLNISKSRFQCDFLGYTAQP